MNKRLAQLREMGTSIWLDELSRDDIQTGDLQLFIRDGVLGVTSNPTMMQRVITASSLYNSQIVQSLSSVRNPHEVYLDLLTTDVRNVCDLFLPVYEQTERGDDGCVSTEVDPGLAYDAEGTVEEARKLWEMIDRPNLLVMIPATREGLRAIEDCVALGISVSPTLVFSIDRYREVTQAYIRGLKRLQEQGGDLTKVVSLALFFLSRVDTETDERLIELGRTELRGKLAIANAKLAYQQFKEVFLSEEWEALESSGANKQRILWASTSTKDYEYSPVKYVESLIGPDVANTLPKGTLAMAMDNLKVRPTLEEDLDDARRVFEQVAEAGVDYDDVTTTLEEDGVKRFKHSHVELMEEIRQRSNLLSRKR